MAYSNEIIINADTQFYIYGCGLKGNRFCEKLLLQNHKIVGFIDQKGKDAFNEFDLPIYKLDDFVLRNKANAVVIISLSNVYQHKKVAVHLSSLGFEYIIYKDVFDTSINYKKIDRIYEKICDMQVVERIEGETLIKFYNLINNMEIIPEKENGRLVVNVPANILFGVSKEFYIKACDNLVTPIPCDLLKIIPDKSVFYFTISKILLWFFANEYNAEKISKYFKIYQRHRDFMNNALLREDFDFDAEFKNHLADRYDIFQKMERLLCINPDFFRESPADVCWNKKGYFNIEDGNNRVAYLLSKHIYNVPCRMSKSDYEKWMNSKLAYNNIYYLQERIKDKLKYPIAHPLFCDYDVVFYSYAPVRLNLLCEFLWSNDVNPEELSVLEIEPEGAYYGQHFARMGSDVKIFSSDNKNTLLCKNIDVLLNVNNITYLEIDYTQCNYEEDVDLLLYSGDNLNCLFKWITQNSKYIKKYVVIDIFDNMEIEETFLKQSHFRTINRLATRLVNNVIHKIVILEKD